jgi:hypothetical protein
VTSIKIFFEILFDFLFYSIIFVCVLILIFGRGTEMIVDTISTKVYKSAPKEPKLESSSFLGKLQEAGVLHAEYVYWQASHESDNFRSGIFHSCNNPFGMKVPYFRKFHGYGTCRGHAGYATLDDAILDYKEWQEFSNIKSYNIRSLEDYLKVLQRLNYAEDQDYVDNVIRHYRTFVTQD